MARRWCCKACTERGLRSSTSPRGSPTSSAIRSRSTRTSRRRRTRASRLTTTFTMCSSCRCPGASTGPSTRRSSTDPLGNQPFERFKSEIAERIAEEPLIDTVLEPGDALYLPRGTVHSAQALGETSIHLTVGVHPLTRYELVRFLLDAVQDDSRLRVSLPVGADLGDPDVLAPHLEDDRGGLARSSGGGPDGPDRRAARDQPHPAHAPAGPRSARAARRRGRAHPGYPPAGADTLCGCGSCPTTTASWCGSSSSTGASTFPPARQMPSASSSIGACSPRLSFPVSTRPTS